MKSVWTHGERKSAKSDDTIQNRTAPSKTDNCLRLLTIPGVRKQTPISDIGWYSTTTIMSVRNQDVADQKTDGSFRNPTVPSKNGH